MTPLTALHLSQVRTFRIDDHTVRHDCLWCGADAWSGKHHTQCASPGCPAQTAAPLDLIAKRYGVSHRAADAMAAKQLNFLERPDAADTRAVQRRVLDFWVACCREPKAYPEAALSSAMQKNGHEVSTCRFSAAILGRQKMQELVKLASETDATFPETWIENPPSPCLVYCVQSVPHTIDRLVVVHSGGGSVIWQRTKFGISGLIGLSPHKPKYVTVDKLSALALQHRLKVAGFIEEVASFFVDKSAEPGRSDWSPDSHMLTACVRGRDDVPEVQACLTGFSHLEDHLKGIEEAELTSLARCQGPPVSWGNLRRAFLETLISPSAKSLSAEAIAFFERTGAHAIDAVSLQLWYESQGRVRLADEIKNLASNCVIYNEKGTVVRKTVNEYQMTTHAGTTPLANFSLDIVNSVQFVERNNFFYKCELRQETYREEVLISHSVLNAPRKLEQQLRSNVRVIGKLGDRKLATIIDHKAFLKYVSPTMSRDAAYVSPIEGTSRVGWSADRSVFHAPGMILDINGRRATPAVFHPEVATLRVFRSVDEWSMSSPAQVHPTCQDIIAILMALTVRYFRQFPSAPACIEQTSDSVPVLAGLMAAIGQTRVFELGHNVRDVANVDGVNGYPFLASGAARGQIGNSSIPYVILTSDGYRMRGSPDQDEIYEAGLALQFALLRVVEWCLATGADDFKSAPSLDHNTALMREGKWLIENVCNLQPWEVGVQPLEALEHVFSQIPLDDTFKRLTLFNGTTMIADLQGVDWDKESVVREIEAMGAQAHVDGDVLHVGASTILPALSKFYGREPKLAMSNKRLD